jgi:hypothetical protein
MPPDEIRSFDGIYYLTCKLSKHFMQLVHVLVLFSIIVNEKQQHFLCSSMQGRYLFCRARPIFTLADVASLITGSL